MACRSHGASRWGRSGLALAGDAAGDDLRGAAQRGAGNNGDRLCRLGGIEHVGDGVERFRQIDDLAAAHGDDGGAGGGREPDAADQHGVCGVYRQGGFKA